MSLFIQPWRNIGLVRLQTQTGQQISRWPQPTRLWRLQHPRLKATSNKPQRLGVKPIKSPPQRTPPQSQSPGSANFLPKSVPNNVDTRRLRPSILKACLFSFAACYGAYVVANMASTGPDSVAEKVFSLVRNDLKERTKQMRPGERTAMIRRIHEDTVTYMFAEWCREHGLGSVADVYGRWRAWWMNLDDGQRATGILMGLNLVPFALWQVTGSLGIQSFLIRSFTHTELSGRVSTLLTSVFSHQSPVHIFLNMFALWSFGPSTFNYLDFRRRQLEYQNSTPEDLSSRQFHGLYSTAHNIAFFMSAGVLANLVPHCGRLLYARYRTGISIPQLTPQICASAGLRFSGSLGASGAIYAIIATWALAFPDRKIGLIFLPGAGLEAKYAFPALLIGFDGVGAVTRAYGAFDHLGHLAGAGVGALAYMYEPALRYYMMDSARKSIDKKKVKDTKSR